MFCFASEIFRDVLATRHPWGSGICRIPLDHLADGQGQTVVPEAQLSCLHTQQHLPVCGQTEEPITGALLGRGPEELAVGPVGHRGHNLARRRASQERNSHSLNANNMVLALSFPVQGECLPVCSHLSNCSHAQAQSTFTFPVSPFS